MLQVVIFGKLIKILDQLSNTRQRHSSCRLHFCWNKPGLHDPRAHPRNQGRQSLIYHSRARNLAEHPRSSETKQHLRLVHPHLRQWSSRADRPIRLQILANTVRPRRGRLATFRRPVHGQIYHCCSPILKRHHRDAQSRIGLPLQLDCSALHGWRMVPAALHSETAHTSPLLPRRRRAGYPLLAFA